jgi:interferon gamma-inducible protein 30
MADIIDLTLIGYGNTAYDASTDTFTCQHGQGECDADVLELCVQYNLAGKDTNTMFEKSFEAWPFILCMEEADGDASQGEACYSSSMLSSNSTSIPSWSVINDCATNDANIVQTAAMNATPDHQYVPWVVVDGDLLEYSSLLQKAVCDAYTGTKPESCKARNFASEANKGLKPDYNNN